MSASASNQAARRVLKVIYILKGNTINGLRLKAIAESLGAPPSTTLRTLELLEDEGTAERIPGREENWRLTPKLIQLSFAHAEEFSRARNHIDELDQRFTRRPV